MGDLPVEALFPQRGSCIELASSSSSSGWSRVLGIDAVRGAPHCDFADQSGARVSSRWCPDWLALTLAGVVLNLAGEVGDQLGSLGQIVAPHGMVMQP
jgi:hypothetical protein